MACEVVLCGPCDALLRYTCMFEQLRYNTFDSTRSNRAKKE